MEDSLSVIQRVANFISVRKTVKSTQTRSARLREELEEAESVEQLIESLFVAYDEMLNEVEKASQSIQRANTKMRNISRERKSQLETLLKEWGYLDRQRRHLFF